MQGGQSTSNVGTNICEKRQHIFLRNKDTSVINALNLYKRGALIFYWYLGAVVVVIVW